MKLDEVKLRDILNSDMKLWENATTVAHESGIGKMLDLPYGIGERVVVFAEVDAASVATFAQTIRGIVNEFKSQSSHSEPSPERVKALEAQADSAVPDGPRSDEGNKAPSMADTASVLAPYIPDAGGTGLADIVSGYARRIEEMEEFVEDALGTIRAMKKSKLAYEAALEILDAPEDPEPKRGSLSREEEEEGVEQVADSTSPPADAGGEVRAS